MGWQTDALIHVSFNRETFDSEGAVREYIEERKEEIQTAKDTLSHLAFMTEPQKFCDKDEDPAEYIRQKLEYAIETLVESSIKLSDASAVLAGWKYSHAPNGGAIQTDDEWLEKKQRVDGDFICAVNPDGSNARPDDEINTSMWERLEESYKRRLKWEAEQKERTEKLNSDDV